MRIGRERAALPGLEIHDVMADRATFQIERLIAGFFQHRDVDSEGRACRFSAGDGLKYQIDWSAPAHRFHLRRDVCKHATLARNLTRLTQPIEHPQQGFNGLEIIRNRIDTDDASPLPYINPSMMLAAIPFGSSVG
jgi:hypothetical protein